MASSRYLLAERGVRVETDLSDDRFGKKIPQRLQGQDPPSPSSPARTWRQAVSFRLRDGSRSMALPLIAQSI